MRFSRRALIVGWTGLLTPLPAHPAVPDADPRVVALLGTYDVEQLEAELMTLRRVLQGDLILVDLGGAPHGLSRGKRLYFEIARWERALPQCHLAAQRHAVEQHLHWLRRALASAANQT